MPFLAKEHVPIPAEDLLSWIFDNLSYDWDTPVYIDAADPSKSINARQAKSIIRKLAAGFQHAGLQKGETVCLHSFNHVRFYTILSEVLVDCWSSSTTQ
jgi:non-ribosomal peptide synthetase component E (peptide arylation enzyme)